jgi:hypothetical protein
MDGGSVTYGSMISEQTVGDLLGNLSTRLDITKTQYDQAKSAYSAIAEVINSSSSSILRAAKVFPQGSFATSTVVRPIDDSAEFDVDLICRLASTSGTLTPRAAKDSVGRALLNSERYAKRTTPKDRCWRVEYAGEFHLDVAPVVPQQPAILGDLIPDKTLNDWVPTHPEAYAAWFNKLADTSTSRLLLERQVVAKAEVVPFPDAPGNVGWLRRTVQLLKRHRCIWNETQAENKQEYRPISIIIATLAARAYETAIARDRFQTPYGLMRTIVNDMGNYVVVEDVNGVPEVKIMSPVANENFANKWAKSPLWQQQFLAWHATARQTFVGAINVKGVDELAKVLGDRFGAKPTREALLEYAAATKSSTGVKASPVSGLVTNAGVSGLAIKPHTFYGDTSN